MITKQGRKSSGTEEPPATDHREIEWQFDADDLEPVEGWLGQHASGSSGLAVAPDSTVGITDSYYDTDDWRLYRAGYALRVRETDDEVEATLTELPGIGPWTARGFLLVALDRPDVFLSGDLALRRAIQRAYGFDHLPTEEEVAEVSDRWRPDRSLAVSYLFASEYDA